MAAILDLSGMATRGIIQPVYCYIMMLVMSIHGTNIRNVHKIESFWSLDNNELCGFAYSDYTPKMVYSYPSETAIIHILTPGCHTNKMIPHMFCPF